MSIIPWFLLLRSYSSIERTSVNVQTNITECGGVAELNDRHTERTGHPRRLAADLAHMRIRHSNGVQCHVGTPTKPAQYSLNFDSLARQRVKIVDSKIRGRGVLATEPYFPGDVICKYKGEVRADHVWNPYLMALDEKTCCTINGDRNCIASIINDGGNRFPNNTSFCCVDPGGIPDYILKRFPDERLNTTVARTRVFVVAHLTIYAGDELFADYGKQYWKTSAAECGIKKM